MNFEKKRFKMFHIASFEYRRKAFENHLYDANTKDKIVEAFIGVSLKTDIDNYIYYTGLLYDLNIKLEDGLPIEDILNNLVKTAVEYKEKVKEKKLSLDWANGINEKYKKEFLLDIKKALVRRVEMNKNAFRSSLVELEKKQVENSKKSYIYFSDKVARGKAIGGLNRGFFGDSLDGFKENNKSLVGPFSTDDRLVKYMSDDLLRFRVAIMDIADRYNKKMKSYAKIADLDYLINSFEEIGSCAKETYKEFYGIYPEDEIKQNIKRENLKRHRLPSEDGVQIEMSDLIQKKI